MNGRVADYRIAAGERDDTRHWKMPSARRPPGVPAGSWRRMSALARTLVVQHLALRAAHPALDWGEMPLVWGTASGEIVPSTSFLDRVLADPPELGSPTAFQNSVYNATPGHSSLVLGLHGPSETVTAGQASAGAALHRGLSLLKRYPAVLVSVGETVAPAMLAAWSLVPGPVGEAVVSVILTRGEGLDVRWGRHRGVGPQIHRHSVLPWETSAGPMGDVDAAERCGHTVAAGLVALLERGAGTLVEHDDNTAITVQLTSAARP